MCPDCRSDKSENFGIIKSCRRNSPEKDDNIWTEKNPYGLQIYHRNEFPPEWHSVNKNSTFIASQSWDLWLHCILSTTKVNTQRCITWFKGAQAQTVWVMGKIKMSWWVIFQAFSPQAGLHLKKSHQTHNLLWLPQPTHSAGCWPSLQRTYRDTLHTR